MARGKSESGLSKFDGREVLTSAIRVKKAGDGLSQQMAVEPIEWHTGERAYVVLGCVIGDINHKLIKDTDSYSRVHDFIADEAIIVDEDLVRSHLDAMAERIEQATGVQRLPDGDLYAAHMAGEHADGLVDGCTSCQAEIDAEAAEAAG